MIAPAPSAPQRIAIVGTGISGLTCAYLLHGKHRVTVFEADGRVGGHTHTVDVNLGGEHQAVDTGFIVYNERNYPNFTRLLGGLGVATKPTSMSFSVRCDQSDLEYNGTSLNRLFAQRRNLFRPRFHGMLRDILRFNREAPEFLETGDEATTVAEFLEEGDYGESFGEHYLLPMGAALWSCPTGTFREFPVRFVIDFMRNHALFDLSGRPQWRVIEGGSNRYVEKLTEGFRERIRLNSPVVSVLRGEDGVSVTTASGETEEFDHVILACHSDTALRMLADPSKTEEELLSAFPYEPNDVVLHTDTSVLPKRRLAWGAWNYHVRDGDAEKSTVTYNMNILQGLRSRHTYCVTLNETDTIDESKIIRRFRYDHPVFTSWRESAQARHGELIGRRRTSYCGAYWGYGFHEDGVRSALAVCEAFGERLS